MLTTNVPVIQGWFVNKIPIFNRALKRLGNANPISATSKNIGKGRKSLFRGDKTMAQKTDGGTVFHHAIYRVNTEGYGVLHLNFEFSKKSKYGRTENEKLSIQKRKIKYPRGHLVGKKVHGIK